MLIGRCAWHTRYHGYPLWNQIASWRGVGVRFTDGICARCVERFRDEHRRFLERRRPAGPSLVDDLEREARDVAAPSVA